MQGRFQTWGLILIKWKRRVRMLVRAQVPIYHRITSIGRIQYRKYFGIDSFRYEKLKTRTTNITKQLLRNLSYLKTKARTQCWCDYQREEGIWCPDSHETNLYNYRDAGVTPRVRRENSVTCFRRRSKRYATYLTCTKDHSSDQHTCNIGATNVP